MSESKTPISAAGSYRESGEYWDQDDLSEHWDQTHPVEIEVRIESSAIYFPVERSLAEQIRIAADAHGVSPETLLNLWIQQRFEDEDRQKQKAGIKL